MALMNANTARGFSGLPALRQLGLMAGLAASVALGVAVVLWSQTPNYSLLYGSLSAKDSSDVVQALQQAKIPYKVDETNGAVLVPSTEVHEARMKLASGGLPKGMGNGFELLDKEQQLGTSQFIEQARYQHALEIELARSISELDNVRNARVHLAIPKRSVFVRRNDKPTASVVLDVYPGRELERGQVAAVVHLVASSVPNLSPDSITVVDQTGRLLTTEASDRGMALSSSQFEYTRRVEQSYAKRVEDLLTPVMGVGRVRAQVVADLDFTSVEKTRESYDPDLPALRSEQVVKEQSGSNSAGGGGVPGALSNEPPPAGTTNPAAAPGDANNNAGAAKGHNGSSTVRTVRNFELDKTVSHTRVPAGKLRKLSVAVVVDDKQKVGDDGTVQRTPLSAKEIASLTSLVKDAVGFDARRGDTINVINTAFVQPQAPQALPEPPIWQRPWAQDLARQAAGGLAVLLLVFFVLRPVMRSLTEKGAALPAPMPVGAGMEGDQLSLSGQGQGQLPPPNRYEDQLAVAKTMATQDPGRVAQVVKTWVGNDG